MESNQIKQLVHKYLAGESSRKEETILKDYFSLENIDVTLQEYQPMFNYFTKEKDLKSSQELPELLTLEEKKKTRTWISIAASVVVLLGVGTYLFSPLENSKSEKNLGTYDDPEVAFKETQKALAMLSNHVNSGVEGMRYIQEFEKTKNKIFNPLIKN
jgi:hypothetical protein